jgi:hypothetical protein
MWELKINNNKIINWNNYLWEICILTIEGRDLDENGGPGKIVEIDEILFSKRKNNAGQTMFVCAERPTNAF